MSNNVYWQQRLMKSKKSAEKIEQLRNLHLGQRCFLIGNGPSLEIADLDKLAGEITFACNNIHLSFPQTNWRPSYYTVSDPLAAKRYAEVIDSLAVNKIFSDSVKPYVNDSPNVVWLAQIQYASDQDLSDFAFSFDLRNGVYHGASTLYIQLQVAFFMGIEEVYLVGVDFDYAQPSKIGRRSGLGVIVEHQEERNHFHPDYRQPGETWWLADKEFQYKTFSSAKSVFEAHSKRIFNASRRTMLDIFPQVEFDSVIR